MPARTRTVLALMLLMLVAVPLLTPGPASASVPLMVKKINKARRANGLPALRYSASLERSSRRFARHLMKINRFGHAARIRASSHFRMLGECLGRYGGWRIQRSRIVRAWLHSPVHRGILLSHRFNRVGAAPARGNLWGRRATIWVAQFGRAG